MADAQAYRELLQSLLPPGAAFNREDNTAIGAVLIALGDELARIDGRVINLLTEADPRLATELLPDWERVTGLPDSCVPTVGTIAERRAAVAQRLGTLGGQSQAYLVYIASLLGFEITITEYKPFRVGYSAVGDALTNGPWAHTFTVNGPEETIRYFRVGSGAVGEPLASWGNELLECAINRLKPAHTHAIFAYGEA